MKNLQIVRQHHWHHIALCATVLTCLPLTLMFPLWFSPGWANGWPGSLSIHYVWPAGLATLTFVSILSASVWVGAAIAGRAQDVLGKPPRRWAIVSWLLVSSSAAIAVWVGVYTFLRIEALEMW